MIARNEEAFIANALHSVKGEVDEIIVVDTGSSDNTRQIAEECGATIYDFKWENDFSKARNFAKSMAKSDWILFLDADECLAKDDLKDLKKVIAGETKQQHDKKEHDVVVAFSFIQRHYAKEKGKFAHWKQLSQEEKEALRKQFAFFAFPETLNGYYDTRFITRLFKNTKNIYFKGAVHEDVMPSILEWGQSEPEKTVVQCDIPIHHFNFLKSKTYVQDKQKLYFDLSKERVKLLKDTKTCLDLATGYAIFEKNLQESYVWVKEAVLCQETFDKKNKESEEKIRQIDMLYKNNKQLRALHELIKLLDLQNTDGNTLMNLAKAYYSIKAYRAAIVILKKLFDAASADPLIIEYLGTCYDHINYFDDAIRVFEHGIIVHSEHAGFYFNLGALYEKTKEWKKAIAAFEGAMRLNHPLKEQLEKRIIILRDIALGKHVHYKISMGNV
jgi:glycosyltransferase involved in cell wall biosynthesis